MEQLLSGASIVIYTLDIFFTFEATGILMSRMLARQPIGRLEPAEPKDVVTASRPPTSVVSELGIEHAICCVEFQRLAAEVPYATYRIDRVLIPSWVAWNGTSPSQRHVRIHLAFPHTHPELAGIISSSRKERRTEIIFVAHERFVCGQRGNFGIGDIECAWIVGAT
jgi:hypothetical protein